MKTGSWPEGYGRRVLAVVDSTNAEAARRRAELAGPEWFLGLRQTSGKGRRGRHWADPPGNFAATLVLPAPGTPMQAALRSFVAALALYDTFVSLTGRAEAFSLKWPNDVLLNAGKVAGILLEGLPGGALAIGIGVNLTAAPRQVDLGNAAWRPVSLVSETGIAIGPEEFLTYLAAAYAEWETRFVTFGFAPIREAWLQRAARLGEVITARAEKSEKTGTFVDVDLAGQLVLRTPAGRETIPAADVYF